MANKIFCANCINCKVFRHYSSDKTAYTQKVRCTAVQWKKPGGGEKTYFLHTLLNRQMEKCSEFEFAGDNLADEQTFIQSLRRTLPGSKIIHTVTAIGR